MILERFIRQTSSSSSALFAGIAILLLPSLGIAQETSTYKEQGKLIRAPEAVSKLGTDLFGDKVNLYTGTLEFTQMDVSLPGNSGLPVSVGRRLIVGQERRSHSLFGGWDLEIPHLHGVFASAAIWKTGLGTNPNARCSTYGPPPSANGSFGSNGSWNPTEFWRGSFLYIPGTGDQELLRRSVTNTQAPGGNSAAYPIVTRNNWAIRCLPSMAPGNGVLGEAFIAVSPDGTEYRFDWLVTRPLPFLTKANVGPEGESAKTPWGSTESTIKLGGEAHAIGGGTTDAFYGNALTRAEVWILPTQVTDRFGNTVNYTITKRTSGNSSRLWGTTLPGSPARSRSHMQRQDR